jgi:hypothetical protein
MIPIQQFEQILDKLTALLTERARESIFPSASQFEAVVRVEISKLLAQTDMSVDFSPRAQGFPDIALGLYGIEVKHTLNDTWRTIGNSVSESKRDVDVVHIYVVFGKMGGNAEVRWGRYGDSVVHVRTTHVPRFEVEINPNRSLFADMGVTYENFIGLDFSEKMKHIRAYAKKRVLRTGEHLWWIDDRDESEHSLPIQPRLYVHLDKQTKKKLRAEAALLCPQVVKSGRGMSNKDKYNDFVSYMLTAHGVLCTQARDLFSAGSAGGTKGGRRGGNYILEGLKDIEEEMLAAAQYLPNSLFEEYWGRQVPPQERLVEWLKIADSMATDWKPSNSLFLSLEFIIGE